MRVILEFAILFSPVVTAVLALGAAILFYRTPNGMMRGFLAFFLLQAVAYTWLGVTEIGLRAGASWLEAREVRAVVFRLLSLLSYGQLLWRLRR